MRVKTILGRRAAKEAEKYYEGRQREIARGRLARIEKIKKIMSEFVDNFPCVEKVAIVGSTIKPKFYRSESDIDLVVKGLKTEDIFKAGAYLEKRLGISLDLIPWEDISSREKGTFRNRRIVYEKK